MRGKTRDVGSKTRKHTRYSALDVEGKDPNSDYSFRSTKAVDEGGGIDMYGYEPVGVKNHAGEQWGGPRGLQHRGGQKQIRFQDTILCKRPKEVSAYFQAEEDEKYNAQTRLVKTAAQDAQVQFRQVVPDGVVHNKSEGLERACKQRPGPTQEEEDGKRG